MGRRAVFVVWVIFLFVLVFVSGCGGGPEFSNSGQKNDPLKMIFEIQTKPNQCRIIVSDYNNENNLVYEGLSESESKPDSNSGFQETDCGKVNFTLPAGDYKITVSKNGYGLKNRYVYFNYGNCVKFTIDLTQEDEPKE